CALPIYEQRYRFRPNARSSAYSLVLLCTSTRRRVSRHDLAGITIQRMRGARTVSKVGGDQPLVGDLQTLQPGPLPMRRSQSPKASVLGKTVRLSTRAS